MADPVVSNADKERLLRHISEKSGENPFTNLAIDQCSQEAGLSAIQGRVAAQFLLAKGWVQLVGMGSSHIAITPAGVEECHRLAVPKWRRWMRDRTIVVPLIVSITTAVVVVILRDLLPLLWKKK